MPGVRRRALSLFAALVVALVVAGGLVRPVAAQGLVRDAGVEHALRQIAAPLLTAAGLPASRIQILLINDPTMNAFVVDSNHIFMHTGMLMRLSTAAEVQAVLAHEAAHIANGHIARRMTNMRSAALGSRLGLLLALAAGAAGAPGNAIMGIAAGTSGSAQRIFLSHTRGEESSADRSGVRYMAQAQVDPGAMLDVLDLFRGQEALAPGRQDPYLLSHPLTRDRLRGLRGFVAAQQGRQFSDNETVDYWFSRAKAVVGAFMQNPAVTLRNLRRDDTSDAALISRAVAYHRQSRTTQALDAIDTVIARRPNDPYLMDLRGQILLESRQYAGAVNAYAKAASLGPNEPLILAGYGRALLARDTPESNRQALGVLERAQAGDANDPGMLRDLAVAYAKVGNNGMASVATAERYAVLGRLRDAGVHARRATGMVPRGSPGWLRAQDVLNMVEAAE